jgi:hypothetical protein
VHVCTGFPRIWTQCCATLSSNLSFIINDICTSTHSPCIRVQKKIGLKIRGCRSVVNRTPLLGRAANCDFLRTQESVAGIKGPRSVPPRPGSRTELHQILHQIVRRRDSKSSCALLSTPLKTHVLRLLVQRRQRNTSILSFCSRTNARSSELPVYPLQQQSS